MSETITTQKKKKKIFNYEEAVKILRPLITKWTELDKEVAKKLHEYYMMPDCRFNKLCELLDVHHTTIYALFDKYDFPRKHEAMTEHEHSNQFIANNQQELEPAIVEDEQETEYDTIKYQETYSILNNAQRLSINMFRVVEKQELINKLQKTIKHLTTLLLKLESNIEE